MTNSTATNIEGLLLWGHEQLCALLDSTDPRRGRSGPVSPVSAQSLRREVELLMGAVLGWDRVKVLTYPEYELTNLQRESFCELSERRAAGEPLAYLLGKKEFFGFELEVSPAVLIPRPETELLVEFALEEIEALKPGEKLSVLDLGIGSGAILCALIDSLSSKSSLESYAFAGIDISAAALEVAGRNLERVVALKYAEQDKQKKAWMKLFHGDLGDANLLTTILCAQRKHFFANEEPLVWKILIVSNPPYISEDENLPYDVDRFEPHGALRAASQGTAAIAALVAAVKIAVKIAVKKAIEELASGEAAFFRSNCQLDAEKLEADKLDAFKLDAEKLEPSSRYRVELVVGCEFGAGMEEQVLKIFSEELNDQVELSFRKDLAGIVRAVIARSSCALL